MDEEVRAPVELQQLGAERDPAPELDPIRDAELGRARTHLRDHGAATDPNDAVPTRALSFQKSECLDEKNRILLDVETADGEEFELAGPVLVLRPCGHLVFAHHRLRHDVETRALATVVLGDLGPGDDSLGATGE